MPNITQGILPVLLSPGLDINLWEFGYYKLSSVNEAFDISKVSNWQNEPIFRGVSDGTYFIVARLRAKQTVFDYKKETLSCNATVCILRVLAVTRVASVSSCTLKVLAVMKVASGGGGSSGETFRGIILLGRNI